MFTKLEKVRRNLFKEDVNREVNTRQNVTETAAKEVKEIVHDIIEEA